MGLSEIRRIWYENVDSPVDDYRNSVKTITADNIASKQIVKIASFVRKSVRVNRYAMQIAA